MTSIKTASKTVSAINDRIDRAIALLPSTEQISKGCIKAFIAIAFVNAAIIYGVGLGIYRAVQALQRWWVNNHVGQCTIVAVIEFAADTYERLPEYRIQILLFKVRAQKAVVRQLHRAEVARLKYSPIVFGAVNRTFEIAFGLS